MGRPAPILLVWIFMGVSPFERSAEHQACPAPTEQKSRNPLAVPGGAAGHWDRLGGTAACHDPASDRPTTDLVRGRGVGPPLGCSARVLSFPAPASMDQRTTDLSRSV